MKPRIVYYTFLFLTSLIVIGSLALSTGLNRKDALELDDMIYGTAPKPFVYRQLMPAAIRLGIQAIPAEMRNMLNEKADQSSTMSRILSRVKIPSELFVEYALSVVFIYAALWGFVLSFRFFYKKLYESPLYLADVATLAALIGIPAFFSYSFIYDIPTLFLFTLGAGMMVSRKWSLYLLVFFLGCWSKETTILLTLIFVLHFYKNDQCDQTLFKKLLVAQLGIFLLVKIILEVVFYDNPGSLVEFHFIHNILFGYQYSLMQFLAWIFLLLLIAYKWNKKPVFLKNALWIGVPLLILTLFLGLLHEMRDYGELYPILIGLMVHSMALIVGVPCSPKENI